ncbi:hypothetical protein ACI2JA_19855 [Alkalihalobacillus sp. NPDC078783]|uniref:hypothetical protein n=1 Tax=Streptomyces albidoflavus TaxID=1886 RepID=UPI0033CE26A2
MTVEQTKVETPEQTEVVATQTSTQAPEKKESGTGESLVAAKKEEKKVSDEPVVDGEETATYKAEIEGLKSQLETLTQERDQLLNEKPKEKTEAELKLETEMKEFQDQKIAFEFEKRGMSDFADLIKVDAENLEDTFTALEKVLNERKMDNSYKPTGTGSEGDAYSIAKEKGDAAGLFKGVLFGNRK